MNDNTISANRSMMKTTAKQLREKAAYELSCKRSALHEILIKGAEALDLATNLVTYFEREYQDSISRSEAIENVEILKEKVASLEAEATKYEGLLRGQAAEISRPFLARIAELEAERDRLKRALQDIQLRCVHQVQYQMDWHRIIGGIVRAALSSTQSCP